MALYGLFRLKRAGGYRKESARSEKGTLGSGESARTLEIQRATKKDRREERQLMVNIKQGSPGLLLESSFYQNRLDFSLSVRLE